MKYLRKILLLSTILLMFSSCAALKNRLMIYNAPDQGYLVLSQSATKNTVYGSYTLNIKYKDKEEFIVIYLQNNAFSPDKRDFDDEISNGSITIQNLPPGKYTIYSYEVRQQGEGLSWKPINDISIPFEIKTNEVTYLGEYLAISQTAKNIFGMTIPWGAIIKVQDNFDRDITIIKQRNKIFNNMKINKQIPAVETL